ncbi:MAG TPA: hypothetical protein VFE92_13645 [Dermatophilaceae bacterium]|nr:hypothetical protein [Dermatophilaceae bacterium]
MEAKAIGQLGEHVPKPVPVQRRSRLSGAPASGGEACGLDLASQDALTSGCLVERAGR